MATKRMASSREDNMTDERTDPRLIVSELFGLYKAEWLNGQLFELFTKPEYFDELQTNRPCVLIGGRGTGKTTVLRGMSYQGQLAMSGNDPSLIQNWRYFGLYYRVDTNYVAAFKGLELTEDRWARWFAHFINLEFSALILDFIEWYRLRTSHLVELDRKILQRISLSLNLRPCATLDELADEIDTAKVSLQAAVNNVGDDPPILLSMQAAPINLLAEALSALTLFANKQFFFLVDEYENLEDYQQQVVNTLIKHAKPSYTFKIGVRELGWRERATRNPNERLTHPADYARINIRENFSATRFSEFAKRVCNGRLKRVDFGNVAHTTSIQELLPELSEVDEAVLLGIADANNRTLADIESNGTSDDRRIAESMSPAMLYLVRFWSEGDHGSLIEILRDVPRSPEKWRDRYNNHFQAALFAIRRGKRGIRKYYAGWDVFTQLADGNIRFLLELIHQSFLYHFAEDGQIGIPISSANQTKAAQQVGRKQLEELEGISVEGGRLTKLLLSLGRIFEVLAENPEGHTPEATQFHVVAMEELPADRAATDVEELLRLAVVHQALVRSPGNKRLDEQDTREYDYRVHPIFCAFFVFSYRQKRKIQLKARQFLGLIERPRETIREVLSQNHRPDDEQPALPDQLGLWEGFYHGNS
jgi:hypothetical protein